MSAQTLIQPLDLVRLAASISELRLSHLSARKLLKVEAYLSISTKPHLGASSKSNALDGSTKSTVPKKTAPAKPAPSAASLLPINGGIAKQNKSFLDKEAMKKDDNPICHSLAPMRDAPVQSVASGHQGGGGGSRWTVHRNAKLALQAAPKKTTILAGCICYVNGYTGTDITNEQLKDVIEENGGSVRTMPSAKCTHIFVHQNLSASKTEKFLKCRTNKTRYVYPAWAIESAKAGRRLAEANFASPVFSETQISVNAIYGKGNDVRVLHPAAFESAADIAPTPPRAGHLKSHTHSPPPLRPSPRTASQPRKIRASQPPSPSPKERRSLKKFPSREIVVLEDSSQVEVEERPHREVKKGTLAVHESSSEKEESEEELDEWGMPPSGQKCGRA